MASQNPDPNAEPESRLEKIMKEKFGSPDFGNFMQSIVDKMLDSMNAPEAPQKETLPP